MAITTAGIVKNLRHNEITLAVGMMGILSLLFIPLPAFILDAMFTLSITAAIMVLLTVLFIDKALEFSAFPMLLLITTMLRLALNVASTRLILSEGHQSSAAAGKIIETFGQIVMSGQFIIGLIIFLILVIVNFVVITKGATRIAEVAARFTLDSLPGKQMAIDADLNAGLISEDQARARRAELEQETGFFGAMDGASKFVRGDAIAGLIITGLNILVGISIGIITHDMSAGEAADRYMLLTVGDGLVAQIPAIIISTAAGILVAKSGTVEAAGTVVFGQIGRNPKALFVAAGVLGMISLMPNMPVLPFWLMGGLLAAVGYFVLADRKQAVVDAEQAEVDAAAAEAQPEEEPIESILHIDTLRLELGYGLLNLIDEAKGGKLTEQIRGMRRQMAKEIGFIVPRVRIQDNMQLDPGGYVISIKNIEAGSAVLKPGMLMAMDHTGGMAAELEGEDTTEPAFNFPAKWIEESKREEASFNGYSVVDNATILVTHLTEIIKDNMAELLTRAEVDSLMEKTRGEYGKLIDDLTSHINTGVIQKVLQNLLNERVSIRDLPTILEALSDTAPYTKNVASLTEAVRKRLSRQICMQHVGGDGVIPIVSMSAGWEKEFGASIHVDGDDRQLAMEPSKVQSFVRSTRDVFEPLYNGGQQAVLLTSAANRPYVRSLLERTIPSVAVLSQAEIHPKAKIKTVGTV